jgi:hypothetical protein
MKLLGNEENSDPSNRPQIRTSQDDAAVGYGFHPSQENEFPAAFVPKRWTGTEEIIDVSAYYISFCAIIVYNNNMYCTKKNCVC